MSWSPTVTALIPAYNAEPFVEEAVRSALDQDYPAELLQVVVVDDGSTDATAAIVARLVAETDGRVRLVRQENRGLVGAVNRAAAEADGELLALLDADDVWPADKIRRQIAVLAARPDVGLVYTDMRVIDAEGRVLDRSWLRGKQRPPEGREVGRLLEQNSVTASSILVRAALRDELFPIPAELPWADWWLGVRAAQVSQIAYVAEPKTSYRFHGANMSLGSTGELRLRELRKALALQRWFLRRLPVPATPIFDLEHAWDSFVTLAVEALEVAGTPFAQLVEVDEDERSAARALADDARALHADGALHEALGAAVHAAATDPSCDAGRAVLLAVRAALPDGVGQQPLRGSQAFVVCVPADELVRDPALLGACARVLGDVPELTLAIDASTADPAEAAVRIGALAREEGLDGEDGLDLLLVTGPLDELGRARLAHGTCARVGARASAGNTPCFTREELAALRELALARGMASPSAAA